MTPVEALQEALREEHRAIYVIGLAGGRAAALRDTRRTTRLQAALTEAYAAHTAQRSWLEDRIHLLGGDPVTAELTYPVPSAMVTEDQLRAAAAQVEDRCVSAYLGLVGSTPGGTPLRRAAVTAHGDAAVRGLTFGSPPAPLPGYPR